MKRRWGESGKVGEYRQEVSEIMESGGHLVDFGRETSDQNRKGTDG